MFCVSTERIEDLILDFPDSLANQIAQANPAGWLMYLGGLHEVKRWQTGLPVCEGFSETDYQHVAGMQVMHREIRSVFPALARALNEPYIDDECVFHDGGELCAGDMSKSDALYKVMQEYKKLNELHGFQFGVLPLFDLKFHVALLKMFREFEQLPQDNADVHYVRFIDIAQGAITAAHVLFSEPTDHRQIQECQTSITGYAEIVAAKLRGSAKTAMIEAGKWIAARA